MSTCDCCGVDWRVLRDERDALVLQIETLMNEVEKLLQESKEDFIKAEKQLTEKDRLNDTLKKIIERVEWRNYSASGQHCPWCGWTKANGHDVDCAIAKALMERAEPFRRQATPASYPMHRIQCPTITSKDATCSCEPIVIKRESLKRVEPVTKCNHEFYPTEAYKCSRCKTVEIEPTL